MTRILKHRTGTCAKFMIMTVLTAALSLRTATAQEVPVVNDEVFGFTGRFSAAADWKVYKGLHISAEYQIRTQNLYTAVERHQVTAGISYKVCDWFRTGLDYTFIGHYKASDRSFRPRHRVSVYAMGIYDIGMWRLSLKETLELTHKSYDINVFQEPRNLLNLRSRLKVSYRGYVPLEPYAYVELRNSFNEPSFNAVLDEDGGKWMDYEFIGYGTAVLNRIRTCIGAEWHLARHHSIDFAVLYHWNHDLEIDANKEGTKLKNLYWDNSMDLAISIGYKFSF
ncbi:MAG: DUF2490 domain-containing protein [Candidatus Cryptobacteroides sp.]